MKTNRFYRFFVLDSQFRLRVMVFIGLLILVGWQKHIIKVGETEFRQVKLNKDLVSRIPEMQSTLKGRYAKRNIMIPQAIELHLKGITRKKDIYYALIDGEIHMIGDSIKDYKITNITKEVVILENQTTHAVKQLYLPE